MRIVAGTHRGRSIAAPEGSGTRPTVDRVREALFSSLFSLRGGFDGAVVFDAFAGSGALGFEALSRGARFAMFCERDKKAASIVRKNASELGFGRTSVHVACADAMSMSVSQFGSRTYDLVFLDPPYAYDSDEVLRFVRSLCGPVIDTDATIVYEYALKDREAVSQSSSRYGFDVLVEKKYGKTGVTVMSPDPDWSQG